MAHPALPGGEARGERPQRRAPQRTLSPHLSASDAGYESFERDWQSPTDRLARVPLAPLFRRLRRSGFRLGGGHMTTRDRERESGRRGRRGEGLIGVSVALIMVLLAAICSTA